MDFEGNGDIHPAGPTEAMHRLMPGSQLVQSPWSAPEWWKGPLPDLYTKLAPPMLQFLQEAEVTAV